MPSKRDLLSYQLALSATSAHSNQHGYGGRFEAHNLVGHSSFWSALFFPALPPSVGGGGELNSNPRSAQTPYSCKRKRGVLSDVSRARVARTTTIGAKINTHATFIVGELISQLHTYISYTALIVEELICVMHVSLVSACLASMMSQKGNYTTVMLVE